MRTWLPGIAPVGLALLLAACGSPSADQVPTSSATPAEPGWASAATSPLSSRHSVRAVTVGDEALFLGGDSSPLCPPGAGCIDVPEPQRDGAAYRPSTDTWRALADAPVAPSLGSVAVVRDRVYLLADGALHSYDVDGDTWTALPAPPDTDGQLAAAGDLLVRFEVTQEGGRVEADHLYDPATRSWRALPRDPLAPAFDRAMVWNGNGLVLAAKPVPPPRPDDNESPPTFVHAATFDPTTRTWTEVPQQDQVLGFGSQFVWSADRLISPYVFDYTGGGSNPGGRLEPTGGLLDVRTGEWESLPPSPGVPPDVLRVQASSANLITAGEGLVLDVPGRRWHVLEPAPGAPPDGVVGTWVGRQLVVFGGGSTSSRQRSPTAKTYLWTSSS